MAAKPQFIELHSVQAAERVTSQVNIASRLEDEEASLRSSFEWKGLPLPSLQKAG
jgi:hypothetical protein